ncbi:hypothetical protein AADH33_00725 [Psychrobacter sp. KFRI-CH2-11]|uniref:hypothetical protein n=1 Tax=Psychrobacter sp. KFRI-CH2-11 TaxID=3156079 RepID=UPI00324D5337
MNIFTKAAVAGLALSVSSFASAAISGSTDFRVTLPEILVLYHWDDAHLILEEVGTTPANDSDAREISDTTTRELTADLGSGSYTINTDVNTTSAAFPTSISVTLKNAWAVRNLSTASGVNLALTNPNSTLTSVTDQTSSVTTSNAVLESAGLTGSGSGTVTIDSGFEAVLGDIKFDLDLTGADSAGEYNTRATAGAAGPTEDATDTFLLTLTANP